MLREQSCRREEFHGKTVLAELYKEHLHSAGLTRALGGRPTPPNSAFAAGAEFDILTHTDPDLLAIKTGLGVRCDT